MIKRTAWFFKRTDIKTLLFFCVTFINTLLFFCVTFLSKPAFYRSGGGADFIKNGRV